MTLPTTFVERWPSLAAWLAGTPDDPSIRREDSGGRRRLLVGQQCLVSPADPSREARRWLEAALPGAPTTEIHLVGHGTGHELECLLEMGAGRVVVRSGRPAVLKLALENWDRPEVLADPRVEFAALDEECPRGAAPPLVLETPFWRRAWPEECAKVRVALGCLRSAALRLRVLVVEPIYGGSLPMARSAADALRALGHEVRSLDVSSMAPAREALQAFTDRHPGSSALAGEFTRMLGHMLLIEARQFKPDLVLGLAQSPFTPECAQALRESGVRTAYWFVEDFETLDYWRGLHGAFDLFLTIQRGRFHQELATLSSAPVAYLPTCADPRIHHGEGWGEGEVPDLSFVGAGYFNRERMFLELLDLPLRIWGSDWKVGGPLAGRLQDGGRRTDAGLNRRIFSNSRVNLNLHSSSYHAGVNPHGDFVNPRTFEILACGGFQLVDSRSLLPELLDPGVDLLTYSNPQELRQLFHEWLPRQEERARMAERGRRAVLARHTYQHRMAELLEILLLKGDAFPQASRRQSLDGGAGDPGLAAWLGALPEDLPRELDAVADWLRSRRQPVDSTGSVLLYMRELRDWARSRGVDRLYDQSRHG